MDKLQEILKIGNKVARQEALVKHARSLRVNVNQARKGSGDLDEDVLTVMLYDAQKSQRSRTSQNWGLIIGAVFLTLAAVAAILLLSKLFVIAR